MNITTAKLTRICVSLIIVILILPCLSFAKIEMGDIAGLWLFDEGSGKVAKDSSGNGNDAEVPGAVKWKDGQFGKAVELDGTPNYITVPHNDMFNFGTDDFSMGCWMDAKRKDAYVIIKRNGGAGFWAMSASIDRETGFFIFEGGGVHIDGGKTVIVNEGWHHCVAVRKKGTVSLYVDGELDVEASIPANADNPAEIKMGGWGSENHEGGLDEVFISKAGVALTEDDVKYIMNGWVQAVSPAGKLAISWGAIKTQ